MWRALLIWLAWLAGPCWLCGQRWRRRRKKNLQPVVSSVRVTIK